jgi:hypothetical protein
MLLVDILDLVDAHDMEDRAGNYYLPFFDFSRGKQFKLNRFL